MKNIAILTALLFGVILQAVSQETLSDNQWEKEYAIPIDSIALSGTYAAAIKPTKKLLVLLVSPPHTADRNFTMRPPQHPHIFKTISSFLNEEGFDTFRFDNRGCGNSQGTVETATVYSHAEDVKKLVRYLENRHQKKIVLLGLSEGGCSSQIVASQTDGIAGLITLSSPTLHGYEAFRYQALQRFEFVEKLYGVDLGNLKEGNLKQALEIVHKDLYQILTDNENEEEAKALAKEYYTKEILNNKNPLIKSTYGTFENFEFYWLSPHQFNFRRYKPSVYLEKVKCPVLALCGSMDDKVEMEPNLTAIERTLKSAGNNRIETVRLLNVTHGYQTVLSTSPWVVDRNEEFSQAAMDAITNWLNSID